MVCVVPVQIPPYITADTESCGGPDRLHPAVVKWLHTRFWNVPEGAQNPVLLFVDPDAQDVGRLALWSCLDHCDIMLKYTGEGTIGDARVQLETGLKELAAETLSENLVSEVDNLTQSAPLWLFAEKVVWEQTVSQAQQKKEATHKERKPKKEAKPKPAAEREGKKAVRKPAPPAGEVEAEAEEPLPVPPPPQPAADPPRDRDKRVVVMGGGAPPAKPASTGPPAEDRTPAKEDRRQERERSPVSDLAHRLKQAKEAESTPRASSSASSSRGNPAPGGTWSQRSGSETGSQRRAESPRRGPPAAPPGAHLKSTEYWDKTVEGQRQGRRPRELSPPPKTHKRGRKS